MRHREACLVAWAGLGLSLAAEVVYVTDLTIFTHLAPCAASAVSDAVMAMTTSACPPGPTELQSCICSTTYNHNIVETRISNSVYGCNSTATGEQASARTVYEAYCDRRANSDEDESNAGVIAGAVVGTVLGLAMVAAGTLFYLRRRRHAKGPTQDGVHPRLTDDEDDDAHPEVYGTAAAIVPTGSSRSSISKSAGPARIDDVSPVLDRTSSRPSIGSVYKQNSPSPTKTTAPPQTSTQQEQADQQTLAVENVASSASQQHTATEEEQSLQQSHQASTQSDVIGQQQSYQASARSEIIGQQQSHQTSARSEVIGQQSHQTSTQSVVTQQEVHSESSIQGTTTTHQQSHEFQFDLADQDSSSTPHASPKVPPQDAFHSAQASQPSSPALALSASPPTRQFLPRLEMQGHQPLVDWSESSYYSTTSRQVSHSDLSSEHSSYTITNAHSPPAAGEYGSRSLSNPQQRAIWRSGSIDGFREMD